MKDAFSALGVIVLIIGLIIGASFGGLALYRAIAPEWEEARTDVYRNTKSYVEGTIRDLRRLKRDYDSADDKQKTALRTIILQRSDEVNMEQMPEDIRRFVEDVRNFSIKEKRDVEESEFGIVVE